MVVSTCRLKKSHEYAYKDLLWKPFHKSKSNAHLDAHYTERLRRGVVETGMEVYWVVGYYKEEE